MRALVITIFLLASARTAIACPRGARCLVATPTMEEAPGPKRPVNLRIEHVDTREPWTFDNAPKRSDEVELPSFWRELRDRAVAHAPRYRGDDGLTFTLSPVVVVAAAFDTVPGIGISGDF